MGVYTQLYNSINLDETTIECVICHNKFHYLLIFKENKCRDCSKYDSMNKSNYYLNHTFEEQIIV